MFGDHFCLVHGITRVFVLDPGHLDWYQAHVIRSKYERRGTFRSGTTSISTSSARECVMVCYG